jgi:hypothetical protein
MRIGVVGGLERTIKQYQRLADEGGHRIEFHDGHVGGHGAAELEALIERADVVVVVTDVNSHGAVRLARRRSHLHGGHLLLLRRCGLRQFRELLQGLHRAAVSPAGPA